MVLHNSLTTLHLKLKKKHTKNNYSDSNLIIDTKYLNMLIVILITKKWKGRSYSTKFMCANDVIKLT